MLRSWREVRAARRAGRRDGRAGIPGPKDGTIPFELREILVRAEGEVEELVQRWRREDAGLAAELAEAERSAALAARRLAEAETRRDAARAEHERRTAEEDERVSRLQAQLEELPMTGGPEIRFGPDEPKTALDAAADAALDPVAGAVGPDPVPAADPAADPAGASDPAAAAGPGLAAVVPHPSAAGERPPVQTSGDVRAAPVRPEEAGWHGIGPFLYWIVIGSILVGEFPLNAVAFRLFGESDLFTYVMTASLAVALVTIAHFLGAVAAGRIGTRGGRWVVGVFTAVLVAGIGVISLIRYDYLNRSGGGTIGPVVGTLSFAAINLVVFAAAAGWSYLHHDPSTVVNRRAAARRAEREAERAERRRTERERHAEEEARRREEERRRRELEAVRERRRQAVELAAARHRAELEAHRNEVMLRREQLLEAIGAIREAARERLAELEGLERAVEAARAAHEGFAGQLRALQRRRQVLREETRARFGLVRARRDRLVAVYCAANVRARKDRTSPRCFEEIPALALPAELEERPAARRRAP